MFYLLLANSALFEVWVDWIETIFPRCQELVLAYLHRNDYKKFQKLEDKNTFLLPPAAPGVVLLELPAFQGSGLITFPSFPFFSHFSQTIFSLKKKSFPNSSGMFLEDTKVTRRAGGREKWLRLGVFHWSHGQLSTWAAACYWRDVQRR